jgi:hypothetical protein
MPPRSMIATEGLVEKHLTQNQMFRNKQTADGSPPPKIVLVYISWYINGCGRPCTSSDVNLRISHVHGQIVGPGGVLPVTTEQKAFAAVRVRPRTSCPWVAVAIVASSFGLVRLRSLAFVEELVALLSLLGS